MPPDTPEVPKLTKGERTATRIMDVAEELFATHGYEGTSLRQIAQGAGLQEPGLYNHFSSKQGLYEAVMATASEVERLRSSATVDQAPLCDGLGA